MKTMSSRLSLEPESLLRETNLKHFRRQKMSQFKASVENIKNDLRKPE